MDEPQRMDIREFREKGFLQEANRHFFHPLGLALEVVTKYCGACHGRGTLPFGPAEGGRRTCDICKGHGEIESLGGVWDYREDPEGIYFSTEVLDEEKARAVRREFVRHLKPRNFMFDVTDGVQPIDR